MKRTLLFLMILSMWAMPLARAGTSSISVTLKTATDDATEKNYLQVDPVSVTLSAGKSVGHAKLSFRAEVSPGQLVELWVDDGGETLPWRRSSIDRSLRADRWVVDGRTGDLIQFDVTGLVTRAIQNEKPLPRLYVRVLPDDDGNPQDLTPARTAGAKITLNLQRK